MSDQQQQDLLNQTETQLTETEARSSNNETTYNTKSKPATHSSLNEEIFKALKAHQGPNSMQDIDLILDIPVKLSVELGRTKMTIGELLRLSQGTTIELDHLSGEPLDIFINNYLIARGEIVSIEKKYGIRITDIVTPAERMRYLSH